jgi:hypothetical protein
VRVTTIAMVLMTPRMKTRKKNPTRTTMNPKRVMTTTIQITMQKKNRTRKLLIPIKKMIPMTTTMIQKTMKKKIRKRKSQRTMMKILN